MEKNFIFFEKYFDLAENLTNEQFGRVLRRIGKSLKENSPPDIENFSNEEAIFCKIIHYEILKNLEKYYAACENNKKNKNINKNNKKINNNYYNNASNYDFSEIESLELARRLKNKPDSNNAVAN